MTSERPIERILDLARWAPSGDNTQPWRFEIVSDSQLIVHSFDTREHCVYDLDGHASHIAVGALLESLRVAATAWGLAASAARVAGTPDTHLLFDVQLAPDREAPSPLVSSITTRSVQRRRLSTRHLTDVEKQELEASVAPDFEVHWLESARQKRAVARLLSANGKLRLTMREAFDVHRSIIDWNQRFSETKVPEQAIGFGPTMSRLMRWALQDWRRVRFLNRYLAGTWLPRLQLDALPALGCAAHLVIVARTPPRSIDDFIASGAVIQRFWLTAESIGLRHQPETTPMIFARYVREGRRFSEQAEIRRLAAANSKRFATLLGTERAERVVWMGRIGEGPRALARSLRLPLASLLVRSSHSSAPTPHVSTDCRGA